MCRTPSFQSPHARHAQLVEHIGDYLVETGRSARWFGFTVARDTRLLPNLRRGQEYGPEVMIKVYRWLLAHYQRQVAAQPAPLCEAT